MTRPVSESVAHEADHVVPVDVLVMGAGAVGCYLGGCLAAAGLRVVFVGRARMLEALDSRGLRVSDLEGRERDVAAESLRLAEVVPPGIRPGLVLLTVKSAATAEAAAELGAVLPAGTTVISFQNGVSNAEVAAEAAPSLRVLRGMVPYNVAELEPGIFHRGTSGRLVAQEDAALRPWRAAFERAGVPMDLASDMRSIQWGKLMLNLNNPVNALSGLPLRRQLLQRGYRRCLAALMDEALEALAWADIRPATLGAVSPRRMPMLLRLPTPVFRLVAARMLRIDAHARSSMADDLARGRRTEIDAFCGEVVRLAEASGQQAPVNARMVALVEGWPTNPVPMPATLLQAELGLI